MKRAALSELAYEDLRNGLMYYNSAGGQKLSAAFLDAVFHAIDRLETHPDAGSPRMQHLAKMQQIRVWQLNRFTTWALYYLQRPDAIDVVRILDGHQNIDVRHFLPVP